jgi:hypothetical protein
MTDFSPKELARDAQQQFVRLMAEELQHKPEHLALMLRPQSALELAGVVQLALRHRGLQGTTRVAAERFLAGVKDYFHDCPAVLEVLRRGDDPSEDQ